MCQEIAANPTDMEVQQNQGPHSGIPNVRISFHADLRQSPRGKDLSISPQGSPTQKRFSHTTAVS